MRKKSKRHDNTPEAQKDWKSLKYPSMSKLLSEEPGTSPWFQLKGSQSFSTSKGLLTWSRPNDGLCLYNENGDVVGIVRDGTIVKQVDSSRLLVSYETRCLNRMWEDLGNTNALDMSLVRIDDLQVIREYKTEMLNMKKQMRQFSFAGSIDAHCSVLLKVTEGVHKYDFPEALKFLDEILHLADYLPAQRQPGQSEDVALFILRPRREEYEVFPQDWYNLEKWDSTYMFPDKAVRDPVSGRVFIRGVRIGDMVLDESNRMVEKC